MNGRIYDPLLGRFLSPDGVVQFADDLQSYNRYSYVRNNPLTKVDPTGWYERDFHYGVVYYIMRARGYSASDSNRIAGFSQYVDNNSKTEPLYTSAKNRAEHHFIGSSEDSATVRNNPEARSRVEDAFGRYGRGEQGSVYRLGDALHGFADTFAHEGFTAWHSDAINTRTGSVRPNTGHADAAEGGHAPDRPYNDTDKAIAAAKAIFDLTPGAPGSEKQQRSWADVEKSLRAGLSYNPNEPDAEKNETKRADNMSNIIKKDFGDDAKYNEKDFAKEKAQFEAAMKQQDEERRKREQK